MDRKNYDAPIGMPEHVMASSDAKHNEPEPAKGTHRITPADPWQFGHGSHRHSMNADELRSIGGACSFRKNLQIELDRLTHVRIEFCVRPGLGVTSRKRWYAGHKESILIAFDEHGKSPCRTPGKALGLQGPFLDFCW